MKKSLQKTAKKGQITLFVLLGIVITGVLFFGLYLRMFSLNKERGEKLPLASQAENVNQYIYGCVKDLAEDGLAEMGKHGGIINPETYYPAHYSRVGYDYYEGKKMLPEISVWEKELSTYVKDNLRMGCNLSVFENLEIDELNRVKVESSFKDSVVVSVVWRVTVGKGNTTFKFENYEANIPVRMRKVYEIVGSIIQNPEQAEFNEYLRTLADITIERYGHEEGLQSVYVIRDYKSKIKYKDYYIFAFAIKP